MAQVAPSVLELLDWVDRRSRTYSEAMEAWTSNCPRHPAWDDALTAGLIKLVKGEVLLTSRGSRQLEQERPGSNPSGRS